MNVRKWNKRRILLAERSECSEHTPTVRFSTVSTPTGSSAMDENTPTQVMCNFYLTLRRHCKDDTSKSRCVSKVNGFWRVFLFFFFWPLFYECTFMMNHGRAACIDPNDLRPLKFKCSPLGKNVTFTATVKVLDALLCISEYCWMLGMFTNIIIFDH